jgi:hypothetical protein
MFCRRKIFSILGCMRNGRQWPIVHSRSQVKSDDLTTSYRVPCHAQPDSPSIESMIPKGAYRLRHWPVRLQHPEPTEPLSD